MKIRLMGLNEEFIKASNLFLALEKEGRIEIISASKIYPNRGYTKEVRGYLEITIKDSERIKKNDVARIKN